MRQPRIAMLADRLTALLPEDGLTVSRAKARLIYDDWTITEREFEGAVALAAARRQITRAFGGRCNCEIQNDDKASVPDLIKLTDKMADPTKYPAH